MTQLNDINPAQVEILKVLIFSTSVGFEKLSQLSDLRDDHFNLSLKKLLKLGLVEKTKDNKYLLTVQGKEYANRLDTDNGAIEKQPKSCVLLVITRTNRKGGMEFLVQQRLKQPFFGFYMLPTGKIRWGETLELTAKRESMEETNLEGSYKLVGITHKRDFMHKTREMLEDKIFYIMHCSDPGGELMSEFEGGKNYWMTREEYYSQDKVIKGSKSVFTHLESEELTFFEEEYYFDKNDY